MYSQFKNRNEVAIMLLPFLNKYRNEDCVVLAIPRGGVPIAHHVAKTFNFPLELLMTKKIGHPMQEEFAIGSVSLDDYTIDEQYELPEIYINEKVTGIRKSLKERYQKFTGGRPPVSLENKVVIIIDDGIATGNTILSAIKMIREKNPNKIVVAVPVAPHAVANKIKNQVDDFICLDTPDPFIGVGLHYADFSQVSDEEVIQLLTDANRDK